MSVCRTTKHPQLSVISMRTGPNFKRSLALDSSGWRYVHQITCRVDRFSPKLLSQTKVRQHASCPVTKRPIHAFRNTILLWCTCTSAVEHYALCTAEIIKRMIAKFQPIVSPKTLDLSVSLFLNHRLPSNKCQKSFILGLQEINSNHPGVIINQSHVISCTTLRSYLV